MASKPLYTVVAFVGIALASGAAWWFQNKPRPAAGEPSATSATGPGNGAAGAPASGASGPARPVSVEVAKVERTSITDDAQAVGSLRSRQSVVVRPEVSGRIRELNFQDGGRVRKGQLLVQLDDQLQLAQVQQAEAELSIANANHKRNQELVAQGFVSQRSIDESGANLQVAQAKLSLARATAARLKIVAPFDGITGIRTVNVGDYLKDGADVVNIEDMDAVFVDFRLPERFQTKLRRGQTAAVQLDALPGRKYSAVIQAIDPLIDANGRSVGVRGCIDNRQLQLRPGMFARVNTVFSERDDALAIPEEAIVPQGARQFVLKVVAGPDADTRITQRVEVKVGVRTPGRVEILEGLKEDDVVVTAGQQRVQRDGAPVRVVDMSRPPGGAGRPGGGQGGPSGGTPPAGSGSPAVPGAGAQPAPAAAPTASPPLAAAPSGTVPARAVPLAAKPVGGPNPCLVGMADMPRPGAPSGGKGGGKAGGGPGADAPARAHGRNPA